MGRDIVVEIKPDISEHLLNDTEIYRRYDEGCCAVKLPNATSHTMIFPQGDSCSVIVDIVSDENKRAVFNWVAKVVKKVSLTIDEFVMRVR